MPKRPMLARHRDGVDGTPWWTSGGVVAGKSETRESGQLEEVRGAGGGERRGREVVEATGGEGGVYRDALIVHRCGGCLL